MTDTSTAPRRVPVLGVLSIVFAVLPILLALFHWVAPDSELGLIGWSGIPLLWLPSIGIGIATVVLTRLGRWRLAGIPAIVLPVVQLAAVVVFLATVVNPG
jgi:hypothetical protein